MRDALDIVVDILPYIRRRPLVNAMWHEEALKYVFYEIVWDDRGNCGFASNDTR